jgi:hypothetical protein
MNEAVNDFLLQIERGLEYLVGSGLVADLAAWVLGSECE